MALLPSKLPQWYEVELKDGEEKGWTPKIETNTTNIANTWKANIELENSNTYTIRIDDLQAISPIQVGSGSLPEGHILPAQIGGIPCIPGSTIRGALLSWIEKKWPDISTEEQTFWNNLISEDKTSWQPRKIRFENISIGNLLKPFPLNAQQYWQVFNQKSKQLAVQWQVPAAEPNSSNITENGSFCIQILLANNDAVTDQQKNWLTTRLKEMLEQQGVGRGKASGFGRLATSIPAKGTWEIQLSGMKPGVYQGKYRWTPQVLRACLRGYFTRLALSLLSVDDAKTLTNKIFGATNCVGQLILTSYLSETYSFSGKLPRDYANIPAEIAHQTWKILVNCNSKFQDLIGKLLELTSYLGGIGPGWRRPPHELRKGRVFRGSEFTVTKANSTEIFTINREKSRDTLTKLINSLQDMIRKLALAERQPLQLRPVAVTGSIISIWQGEKEQWRQIVHNVCRSQKNPDNPNPNRPSWCGNGENRPSGYAVRQHQSFCLMTVFDKDKDVESTLRQKRFQKIYPSN